MRLFAIHTECWADLSAELVGGLGFRLQDSGEGFRILVCGSRVQPSPLGVECLGFRVLRLG